MNINLLRKYEKEGWIYSQVHPTLPLIIWNYSDNTQYENYWDEITLHCRALVTDNEGTIVSKGFKKFFNYSENKTNIPQKIEYVEVWEKMDGSYIGLFSYNNEWIINSKGSFTSDHVFWAKEILKDFNFEVLNKNWTYCFELIHPQNRIVVDYNGEKSLYFLTAFFGGQEIEDIYPKELRETVIKFPHLVQLNTFRPNSLKEDESNNKEGYVVKFQNGERCKIKFDEYVKLHSLYTRTSTYDIWNCLKDGEDISKIIENAPDEIYDWIKSVTQELYNDFKNLFTQINSEYKTIYLSLGKCDDKTFARFVKGNQFEHYMFKMRNEKNIEQQIWKDIKPKYKTFTL